MLKNKKTHLTLTQAHKESGISKSVISKALKDKEIAYSQSPRGKGKQASYQIDKRDFTIWAEKYKETRAQGANAPKNENSELKRTVENKQENTLKIKELELEVKFKDKEIASLKNQLDKSEENAEKWQEQAKSSTLLLTDQSKGGFLKSFLKAVAWGVGGFLFLALAALAYILLVERGVL